MKQARLEARQATVWWKPQWPKRLSRIQRYGLAVLSVCVTLGVALFLERFHFRDAQVPLFLFAVALAAWYAGPGPAVLTLLLSCLSLDYFFLEPIYSFELSGDFPYVIIFASFASLITWFSTVRRRVEGELRQALGRLEIEVAERTQQASLLNLTHDTIFVRDMSDVITYWNQGAQELYGWTAENAIGKHTHELLRSVFPAPIEEIRAELLRSGRWDGEIQKSRSDGTQVIVASRWSLRRDEQGWPVAILETSNDITEHDRLLSFGKKLIAVEIDDR
jgi:PAS domain S-box-containing protein